MAILLVIFSIFTKRKSSNKEEIYEAKCVDNPKKKEIRFLHKSSEFSAGTGPYHFILQRIEEYLRIPAKVKSNTNALNIQQIHPTYISKGYEKIETYLNLFFDT